MQSQPAKSKSQLANTKVSRQLAGQKGKGYVNRPGCCCLSSKTNAGKAQAAKSPGMQTIKSSMPEHSMQTMT